MVRNKGTDNYVLGSKLKVRHQVLQLKLFCSLKQLILEMRLQTLLTYNLSMQPQSSHFSVPLPWEQGMF